jgi:hypothetical protein
MYMYIFVIPYSDGYKALHVNYNVEIVFQKVKLHPNISWISYRWKISKCQIVHLTFENLSLSLLSHLNHILPFPWPPQKRHMWCVRDIKLSSSNKVILTIKFVHQSHSCFSVYIFFNPSYKAFHSSHNYFLHPLHKVFPSIP